jgi:hypothetical protein
MLKALPLWSSQYPTLRRATLFLASAMLLTLGSTAPARADYCIRLSGGSFSGDIGFFRIAGTRPSAANTIKTFAGRAAGLSPVFGSVVINKEGTGAELGATFFIDSSQGQFDISFNPPLSLTGGGYATYGAYNVNTSVTAKIVRCSGEP